MSNVQLVRMPHRDDGTFGTLTLPSGTVIYTVERPWKDNTRNVSCIPEGVYRCVPGWFHRAGYACVEVTGVPDRSRILFHVANYPWDVMGCIGVGRNLAYIDGRYGVTHSRFTFERVFMREMGGKTWTLEITRCA